MSEFWSHLLQLLPYRPLDAARAAYWRLTKRRVRASNIVRQSSATTPLAYPRWLDARDKEVAALSARFPEPGSRPSFTVLVRGSADQPEADWRASRQSAERQHYAAAATLQCEEDKLLQAIASVTTDYLVLLRAGDRLVSSALLRWAARIADHAAAILYGDEDIEGPAGRRTPWFKPDWNLEMFLALDYLSGAVALRRDVALAAVEELGGSGDAAAPLDAVLMRAALLAGDDVAHVPRIVVHRSGVAPPDPQRRKAVAAALSQAGQVSEGPFGTARVRWPLPEPLPLVSIIIPTRDGLDLLETCIGSIAARTDYGPIELVIVDNGSRDPATLQYLSQLEQRGKAKVVRSDAPFNFSALCNLGVRAARGEYLLFLNNDTEVIGADWLSELMRQAARPHVGAVGAKLLYDDRTIQHAGVVIGMGGAAGHAHRFLANEARGYFGQAHVAAYVSAVTAACLLVARRKFEAIGGFDEERFAVAYNDVDLCLRLQQAGWRNVYTPHAVLFHHESKSRGDDLSPAHRERYMRELHALQERWQTRTFNDPLHSPNLDRYSETFLPSFEIGHGE